MKIFGVPIEECVEKGERRGDVPKNVPPIVHDVLTYLRATSLAIVGLFRLAGEKVTTDELRRTLDTGVCVCACMRTRFRLFNGFAGAKVDLYAFDRPHCAADVLKVWLRSLPEPLVTARLFPRFMAVASLHNEKFQVFHLFLSLPP